MVFKKDNKNILILLSVLIHVLWGLFILGIVFGYIFHFPRDLIFATDMIVFLFIAGFYFLYSLIKNSSSKSFHAFVFGFYAFLFVLGVSYFFFHFHWPIKRILFLPLFFGIIANSLLFASLYMDGVEKKVGGLITGVILFLIMLSFIIWKFSLLVQNGFLFSSFIGVCVIFCGLFAVLFLLKNRTHKENIDVK